MPLSMDMERERSRLEPALSNNVLSVIRHRVLTNRYSAKYDLAKWRRGSREFKFSKPFTKSPDDDDSLREKVVSYFSPLILPSLLQHILCFALQVRHKWPRQRRPSPTYSSSLRFTSLSRFFPSTPTKGMVLDWVLGHDQASVTVCSTLLLAGYCQNF